MKFHYMLYKKVIVLYSFDSFYAYFPEKFKWKKNGHYYPIRKQLEPLYAESLEEAKKKIEYMFLEYSL